MDASKRIDTVSRDDRGVIIAPNALLTDLSGDVRVGTGSDWFPEVFDRGVFVDKSLLIRDVIMGSQAVLFCRPRRFGKTLGATMLKDFFECAPLADPLARSRFDRLAIWEVDGGRWRAHQGRHPVIMLSLKGAQGDTWEEMRASLALLVSMELERHRYVAESAAPSPSERGRFERVACGAAPAADGQAPLVVIEVKFLGTETSLEQLELAADDALGQIEQRAYDADAPSSLRWGMAFAGKKMAAACERHGTGGARRR